MKCGYTLREISSDIRIILSNEGFFYEICYTKMSVPYHIYIRIAILLFIMLIYAITPWTYMCNVNVIFTG